MKNVIIMQFLFFAYSAFAQYTYFNNVYPAAAAGTLQESVYITDQGYMSIGFHGASGILGRHVDFDGAEILMQMDYHPLPITGSDPASENCLRIDASHYVIQLSGVNEYQRYYPYVVMLNEDLDTTWTWKPDWPMEAGENFVPHVITQLDNENILAVSMARFGDFGGTDGPDSTGLRFTQLNLDGVEISTHLVIYPDNIYCSEFNVFGVRQVQDFLLLWGRTFPNCIGDRQNFALKTTMEGEILDEFYWGNPNGCAEFQMCGRLLEDDKFAFSYPYCITDDAGNYHQQHIMIFDPVAMQLVSDEPLEIEEWNQSIGDSNNESMVQSTDGSYVTVGYMSGLTNEFPIATPRVFKATAEGEVEWYNEYVSGLETFMEFLFDIENAPDGGFILTGTVEMFPSLTQRHWMLKIDSCGYEQAGFCIPDVVIENENNEVKLWPNPAHHVLKAQLPITTESISIADASGRMVFTEKVYHPSRQWNIRDLERGVYILTVYLEDGRSLQHRFVKE